MRLVGPIHPALLVGSALVFCLPNVARAFTEYFFRPTWTAAVGPASFVEDFNGFVVDTPFRMANGPLSMEGGMTIVEIGPKTEPFFNYVDVPPFTQNGLVVNGTNYISAAVDRNRAPTPSTEVRLTFASPVTAFGADFIHASSQQNLLVDVLGPGDVVLGRLDPISNSRVFSGFSLGAGEFATTLLFRSRFLATPEATREAFGMDDLTVVEAVPEPGGLAILGAALVCRLFVPRSRVPRPARLG